MSNNNPNYIVIIKQTADPQSKGTKGIEIVAPLPDSFAFDTKSDYAAPYAQGLFGGGSGMMARIGKTAGDIGGMRLTSQALTARLWQGATETSLTIALEFHAETDPDLDVRQPILSLLKMATAGVNAQSGLLMSPGPSITMDSIVPVGSSIFGALKDKITGAVPNEGQLITESVFKSKGGETKSAVVSALKSTVKNQISIQIGRYAFFDSVTIDNVAITYSHQLDAATGVPMHATATVMFSPLFIVVQSDLTDIFGSH